MSVLNKKYAPSLQYIFCIGSVLIVATVCFYLFHAVGYKIIALILLMVVSILASLFEILPVLLAAAFSALIWNFFFIPPIFTFHIDNAEDVLMFFLYFFVALVNGVLTFKIREAEKKVRDKEEKDNAIKLYNTLLNSLSHELKTPIATIIGSVDVLIENQAKLSYQNQTELFTEIQKAALRLNMQVENLLNVSRIESGIIKAKYDWCDINELIYTTIQKLDPNIKSQKIYFVENERLPFFKLDGGLLSEVIHNILHNAIQYTPEKSTINIEASYQQNNLIIVVADDGLGFPEKEIRRIFDKFYRIPETKIGGTGLGLTIAKGYVDAHKGKIVVENNKPQGAKFTVVIPSEASFLKFIKNE